MSTGLRDPPPRPHPPPLFTRFTRIQVQILILTQKRARDACSPSSDERDACSLVRTRAQFTRFTSRKVRILTQKAGAAHNSGGAVASRHRQPFRPSSPSARGTYGTTVTPSLEHYTLLSPSQASFMLLLRVCEGCGERASRCSRLRCVCIRVSLSCLLCVHKSISLVFALLVFAWLFSREGLLFLVCLRRSSLEARVRLRAACLLLLEAFVAGSLPAS